MNRFKETVRACLAWAVKQPKALAVTAAGILFILAVPWLFQKEPVEDVTGEIERVLAAHDQTLVQGQERQSAGRILTVLIPYDRTRFFIHKGEPRGFEFELVQQFEQRFNETREAGSEPLQTIFVPVPFGQLIDLLALGKGDIAAGGLTITEERAERIRFSTSYMDDVRELVVVHKGFEIDNNPQVLAGQRVVVVKGSSYVAHLESLSASLQAQGLSGIDIVEAPISIMSEDLLELVHAGAIPMTVVDEHIAELWRDVLDGIEVTEIAIATGNSIAWAFSPNIDEQMASAINEFLADAKRGTLLGNVLFNRYFEATEWIENPLEPSAISEVSRYRPLFSKYASEEGLDWKLVAAVAYQESGFDPSALSQAGAVGLMQVLPSTAAELGYDDLSNPEYQIAAGTRYLASLIRGFESEEIEAFQAINLALAAYNAGPSRLAQLREATASELGLNPNAWFFNVERAAARDVGLETVRYVANVNKYRLAYELGETLLTARAADRERVE